MAALQRYASDAGGGAAAGRLRPAFCGKERPLLVAFPGHETHTPVCRQTRLQSSSVGTGKCARYRPRPMAT